MSQASEGTEGAFPDLLISTLISGLLSDGSRKILRLSDSGAIIVDSVGKVADDENILGGSPVNIPANWTNISALQDSNEAGNIGLIMGITPAGTTLFEFRILLGDVAGLLNFPEGIYQGDGQTLLPRIHNVSSANLILLNSFMYISFPTFGFSKFRVQARFTTIGINGTVDSLIARYFA